MTILALIETSFRNFHFQVDILSGESWKNIVWDEAEKFLGEHGFPEESIIHMYQL